MEAGKAAGLRTILVESNSNLLTDVLERDSVEPRILGEIGPGLVFVVIPGQCIAPELGFQCLHHHPGIDLTHQPGILLQFTIKLTRRPPCITQEKADFIGLIAPEAISSLM